MNRLRAGHGLLLCTFAWAASLVREPVRAIAEDEATSPAASRDAEVEKLRAYTGELLQQIEALRSDLARSEQARKETQALLESVTKRLREQIDEKQTSYARETVRREKEVASTRQELDSAKADEARQAARAQSLERDVVDLRNAIAAQQAERKKLESDVAELERARTDAAHSQAQAISEREEQAQQLAAQLAQAERARETHARELAEEQKRLAAAERELEALKAERAKEVAKSTHLDAEVEKLRAAANEQAVAKQHLATEVDRLARERDDQAKQNLAALAARNAQIEHLAQQLTDADRDAKDRGAELEQQAEQLKATRSALDSLKAERQRRAANVKALEREMSKLRAAAEEETAAKARLEGELSRVAREGDEQAKQNATALEERRRQIGDLTAHVAAAEQSSQAGSMKLEAQNRELTAAREQLSTLKAEGDKQANHASALESEITRLRQTTVAQSAEKERFVAELSQVARSGKEDERKQKRALEAGAQELETLRHDLAKTEEQGRQRLERLDTQAKDLEAARAQLQVFQQETEARKKKAEDLQREIETLRTAARERDAQIARQDDEQRTKDEKNRRQITDLTARAGELESEVARDRAERDRQAEEARRLAEEKRELPARLAATPHGADASAPPRPAAPQQGLGETHAASEQHDAGQRASQDRITTLEAELRDVQRREKASQAAANDLRQALDQEKQASQSKLEALQSVLQNTRSAGAELRSALDDARRRNSDLSKQVSGLSEAVGKVHDLQTKYQQGEFRLQELAHGAKPDRKEMHALRSQQSSIATALQEARSKQVASAADLTQGMSVEPTPPPLDPTESVEGDTEVASADLREQLSVERERRQTLEQEIQRLTVSGNNEEKFVEVWKALQTARSEILVLGNQLADERKSREDLEVTLTRVQRASGAGSQPAGDFAKRLAETLGERRSEASRLADELKNANEIIVRLKGRLEATGSPLAESKILSDLDKDNQSLRQALKSAEEANRNLRAKADMAERLAEMVYGKGR